MIYFSCMPDGISSELLPKMPSPETPKPVSGVEQEKSVEQSLEIAQERVGEQQEQQQTAPSDTAPRHVVVSEPVLEMNDEWKVQILSVLDENLEDAMSDMSPAKKEEFLAAKKELAGKIRSMLDEAVVQFAAILLLVRKWLAMIPRVQTYFLEQESKLKTDKIKKLAEELRAGRVA